MKLSEKGPITQVRLLLDGKHGTETVRVNNEVAQLEEDLEHAIKQYEHWEKEIAEQDKELNQLEEENAAHKRENEALKEQPLVEQAKLLSDRIENECDSFSDMAWPFFDLANDWLRQGIDALLKEKKE